MAGNDVAEKEVQPPTGDAATPEGFAAFKAETLRLSPLEVLTCLERLSPHDQQRVVNEHKRRVTTAAEIANIEREIAEKKAIIEKKQAYLTSSAPKDLGVPSDGLTGGQVGQWPTININPNLLVGGTLDTHKLDAYRYASIGSAGVQGSIKAISDQMKEQYAQESALKELMIKGFDYGTEET